MVSGLTNFLCMQFDQYPFIPCRYMSISKSLLNGYIVSAIHWTIWCIFFKLCFKTNPYRLEYLKDSVSRYSWKSRSDFGHLKFVFPWLQNNINYLKWMSAFQEKSLYWCCIERRLDLILRGCFETASFIHTVYSERSVGKEKQMSFTL